MEVYQTDQDGYYVGPVQAEESPREPGVYHIPAGAVEPQPSTPGENQRVRWFSDAWVLEDIPVEQEEEATFEEQQDEKLAELKATRQEAEAGGTVILSQPVATDDKTRQVLTAAYLRATLDPTYEITNYKVSTGVFVTLTATEIIAFALGVEAHVQATFDNEAALTAQILAAQTPSQLEAIDLDTGWP